MASELVFRWPLPDAVDQKLREQLVHDSKVQVALRLFTSGQVSSGYAAQLLGMSLRDFLELLKKHDVSYSPGSKRAAAAERRTLAWLRAHDRRRPSPS